MRRAREDIALYCLRHAVNRLSPNEVGRHPPIKAVRSKGLAFGEEFRLADGAPNSGMRTIGQARTVTTKSMAETYAEQFTPSAPRWDLPGIACPPPAFLVNGKIIVFS